MKCGGVPVHFIMTMDEYAEKTLKNVQALPWVKDGRSGKMSEEDLKSARMKYYLCDVLVRNKD